MAYRSLAVLTALLALTTSAHSVKFQARHDGEAHQPVHDDHNAELRARQVNGPAAGIAADPERTVLPITIPTAVASQPSEAAVPQETVQALDAVVPTTSSTPILPSANYINSSNGAGTGGPVGYIGEPINNSSDPDGGIDSYSFPSSIVQIPVMTICPNMSGTPFVAIPTAAFMNATAILANGSSTTFLSNTQPTPVLPSAGPGDAGTDPIASAPLSRSGDGIDTDDNRDANAIDKRQPSATSKASDPTARILLGDGGCQTIYSPITTAVCSTTIKLAALPVATVTDCNQYLTFSSQTSDCSRSATPAPVAGGVAADQSMTAASLSVALVLTPSAPGTYYAAHWYDMRSGGVPSNVVVEECPGGCGVNVVSCITARERWSVSYVIGVAVRTSVASFSGVSAPSRPLPSIFYRSVSVIAF